MPEGCLHRNALAQQPLVGAPVAGTSPQARLCLAGPAATRDLFAPSACELPDDVGVAALRTGLGPDPLDGDDPAPTVAALATDDRPVGEVLLDRSLFGCPRCQPG